MLDEDGIWRDDGDDHPYTLRTDSGLGTADRKSSTSTLNRLQETEDGDIRLADESDLRHLDEPDQDFREDSFPLEERSLNISELEASDSCSFDQASLGSSGHLDLPELNVDSDNATDHQVAADFDKDDGYGEQFLQSTGNVSSEFGQSTGFNYSSTHERSHDQEHLDDGFREDRYTNRPHDEHSDSLAGYLFKQRDEGKDLLQELPQIGDSIFTQDDVQHQGQSLVEFEQLETAMASGDVDNMDLIGAYLQGLQDQEDDEELQNELEKSTDLIDSHLLKAQEVEPEHHSIQDEINALKGFHAESDYENEGIDSPSKKLPMGAVFGMAGRYSIVEDRPTIPGDISSDVQASRNRTQSPGDMIPFEESLLENQQPPPGMYSLTLSSLEMTGDSKGNRAMPSQSEMSITLESGSTGKVSKIPMLRSRSPSLSRPGSRSPSGERRGSYSGSRPGSASRVESGSRPTSGSRPNSGSRPRSGSRPNSDSRPGSFKYDPGSRQGSSRYDSGSRPGSSKYNSGSRPGSASEPRRSSIPISRSGSSQPGSQHSSRPSTPDRSRTRRRPYEKTGRTLPQTPSRSDSQSSSRSPSQGRRSLPSISPSHGSPVRSPSRGSPSRSSSHGSAERTVHPVGDVIPEQSLSQEDRALSQAAHLLLTDEDAEVASVTGARTSSHGQKRSASPKIKGRRMRPHSAEPIRAANSFPKDIKPKISSSRPNTPSNFKIRSQTPVWVKGQPMKATPLLTVGDTPEITVSNSFDESEDANTNDSTKKGLSSKFLQEKQQRKQHEETLKQLQQDYNKLLQKYAQAENTIDSLRIGAKIPINVELTSSGPAQVQPSAQGGGSRLSAHRGSTSSVMSLPAQPTG